MFGSQGTVWAAIDEQGWQLQQRKPKRAFSLVELLVVIAVIVILMALLMPLLGSARVSARQANCASNLRQVYFGWTRALTRQTDRPIAPAAWPTRVGPYLEDSAKVFVCPDDLTPASPNSFGLNDHAARFGGTDSGRIVFLEFRQLEVKVVGQSRPALDATWPLQHAARHRQTINVAFFDGHVDSHGPDAIDPRYCALYERYWRPTVDSMVSLPECLLPGGTVGSSAGSSTGTSTAAAGSPSSTSGGTTAAATTIGTTTTTTGTASGTGTTTGLATSTGTTSTGTTSSGTSGTTTTGLSTGTTTGNTGCADCGSFVGVSAVNLTGVSYTDSYNSNVGPYTGATASAAGNVCSNGSITLTGGSMINGSAHPGPGQSVNAGTGAVTGSTTPLSGALALPPVNFGNAATVNNNANIPRTARNRVAYSNGALSISGNDSLTLPAGTYYFTSFSITGSSSIATSGPVIIYCTGDFSAGGGSISNMSQRPSDLQVYCTGTTVSLHGGAAFYGFIYAPQSNISRSGGSSECYGALIGNTLTINGSSGVHFDQALNGLFSVGCQ